MMTPRSIPTNLCLPPDARAILDAAAKRHKVTASAIVADALYVWSGLDPADRAERAQYMRRPASTQKSRALDALRAAGPAGLTREEVAAAAGTRPDQASVLLSQMGAAVRNVAHGRWVAGQTGNEVPKKRKP